MRIRTTGALTATLALLSLTACSGSDAPATPPAAPKQSAPAEPAKVDDAPAAEDEDELKATVLAYSDAYFKPATTTAYEMLSKRCQTDLMFEVFDLSVKAVAADYGKQKIKTLSVDRIGGGMARVTYTYSVPKLSQKAQPWVKESGRWRHDGC